MAFINDDEVIRNVNDISDEERNAIMSFLQGAVYCWCKNRKDEWFNIRDLMGGDNFDWVGTPLYALYEKYEDISDDPIQAAGKDAGWLLKAVINVDNRNFETKKEFIRSYRWIV